MKKQDVGTLSSKILEDLTEQLLIRKEEQIVLTDEIARLEEQVNFYSDQAPAVPVERKRRKRKEETPPEIHTQ